MSSASLARLVHDRGGRVRRCYRDGLADAPQLQGELGLALVVDDAGVVSEARVVDDGLEDAAVGRCVAEALVGGRLEPRPRPEPLLLAFAFAPGEDPEPPLVLPEPAPHRTRQVVAVQLPMPKQTGPQQPRRDPPTPPAPAP